MQRCFSTLGCPELSFEDVLGLARQHGIPGVELRALAGTLDLNEYFTREFGAPEKLAAKWRPVTTSPRVTAFNASLRLAAPTEVDRAQLLAFAPWAEALGVGWLRVFDGGKGGSAEEFAVAADTLRWWRSVRGARRWHVDIMVETHDSLITIKALNEFLGAVPDIAVLWDAHHTWRKGGADPVEVWRAISRRVVHIHVKDSVNLPSARHPFTYVLPGDGGFPMASLREAVLADEYRGHVSLEWEKMWHPYLPSLDEALGTAAVRNWW